MILVLIGTRPELIKMHSVLSFLKQGNIQYLLVSTGQQKDLLHQTAVALNVKIDVDLDLMKPQQHISEFVSTGIIEVTSLIMKFRPEKIVVHGDTSTTFIGAVAGYLNQIPVAHVEAGTRTGNLKQPWPEEGYRRMVDAISMELFAPTQEDLKNLSIDKFQEAYLTGNTGVDIAIEFGQKVPPIERFNFSPKKIVITLHRRESHEGYLKELLTQIAYEAIQHNEIDFYFILHPNPKVLAEVSHALKDSKVTVLEPLDFYGLMNLLSSAWLCLTDSGGLALECVSLGLPVGILREEVEENSIITNGNAVLFGRGHQAISEALRHFKDKTSYLECANKSNPLGDGNSGARIGEILARNSVSANNH
jgi:UDP-N-acetylglucosamine 2-epimerase (non-hydrolysing)